MSHENENAKMAHENEDDEIEQHLVDKISRAINRLDEQQIVTKFYKFKDDFTNVLKALRTKTNPKVGDEWWRVRRTSLYCLNNLVAEWQITKNQTSLSPKEIIESCEEIKRSLRKIKKEVEGDRDPEGSITPHHQRSFFERNKNEVHRWSSRHPPRKVHGLDHRVSAMVRELVMRNVDAPFKVFGVVGAAGIGKTTLCQAIFSKDLVKNYFSPRIWVCLSKQPKDREDYRHEIVVRILKSLGIENEIIDDAGNDPDPVLGLRKLILLMRLQLTSKRYLIVLDDAWNDHKIDGKFLHNLSQKDQLGDKLGEELAYGLPKGYGGTVISSSRSEALLKQMLGNDVVLQCLEKQTDEITYEIFKDTVVGYDDDEREFPEDFNTSWKELVRKCDGVPLAAKFFAEIARRQLKAKPPPAGAGGSHEGKKVPGEVGVIRRG